MKRSFLALFVPPLAVCRYGCAGCCAAPISVFWIAGMVGIVYGLLGGPTNAFGIHWELVGLGVATWLVASVWARLVILGTDEDSCHGKTSTLCNKIVSRPDESDPLEELRKAR
jgi:hypothetical protein